jgi:hypothetical protein
MKTPIDHIRELGPDAVDEFEERAAIREYLWQDDPFQR